MKTRISLFLLLLLFSIPTFAAQPTAVLSLSVTPENVTISGVTPGERVVLFGVSLRNWAGVMRQRRIATIVRDDDGDGRITYTPPEGVVPLQTIYVAVDRQTGAMRIGGRADMTIIQPEFPHGSMKKNAEGFFTALEEARREVHMVLVRPGEGAWLLRASEGGLSDGDRTADGRLTLAFPDAVSLEGSDPAPKHLKKDDVIAAIDMGRLEVFATTIGK